MLDQIAFDHSARLPEWRGRIWGRSLAQKLSSAVRHWSAPVKGAAIALGLSASAYVSPVLAQSICDSVYVTDRDGKVYVIDETDGSYSLKFDVGINWGNPFGISPDGQIGYIAKQRTSAGDPTSIGGTVVVFNMTTGETIRVTEPAITQPNARAYIAGAVNLTNGWFYMAAVNGDADGWHLWAYDPDSGDAAPVYVGDITGTTGINGDMAFDGMGNLFLISGNINDPMPNTHIYRIGQVPRMLGNPSLPATPIAVVEGDPPGDAYGIAFNTKGELVAGVEGRFQWFNPLTGQQIKSFDSGDQVLSDMASCAGGNTIALAKNLPHGRKNSSDQFILQLSGGGLTEVQTQTTEGNDIGVQEIVVGPRLVVDGAQLVIDEAPSAATDFADYSRSWQCVDQTNNDILLASGTAFPGTVTVPSNANPLGSSVLCTITNRLLPEVYLSKNASPVSGTPLEVGDTLTYTLNLEVVNGPTQSDIVLTDTLSNGLTLNPLVGDISPFILGATPGTYILPAGAETGTYTLEYTAEVAAGAMTAVNNSVAGTGGGDPTDPNAPDPVCAPGACATEHPLQTAVVLRKTSNPLPGSIVKPGDLITYTVEVDVVGSATQTEVIITDQLGDGLTFVEVLSGVPPFVQNGNGTFTLPANTPNDEYTLTYTARVDADASVVVNNSVSGTGGGGNPDDPATCIADTCTTEHLIDPLIALSKSAVPASGEFVKAGQELTYTLNVVVERGPTQSPVVITDQLGAGLTYGAPVAPIAPFVETAPGVFTLPTGTVDGTYSVSYTATVDEDAAISVNNSVDGTGGGYPPPDIPNPPEPSKPSCAVGACDTQHPVSPVILLSKDADPDTGTAVEPGDTLTYTVMLEVQNGPTQSEITLTDTMSTGLIFGELVGDISPFEEGAVENTYTLPAGTPNGIYSFSYTATVADDAVGTVGNNVVGTGGGTPGNPGDPGYVDPTCAPQACETEHPLQFAVLLSKTSDPAPGSKVKAGATITYTIEVDVVFSATQSTVTITDELGDGLTYTGVVSGGDIFEVDETGLPNLVFTLPPNTPSGEYYITYTAEVNDDATVSVNNSVTGVGGGGPDFPGPQCDYDEDVFCSTEHPVEPNIFLSKRADPETGTQVNAGDTLTYTLQLTVTNGPTQSDVELEDWSEGLTFGGIVDLGEFEYVQEGGYFVLPSGAENGIYELSYTATVDADARVSVNNSVAGIGGGIPGDPDPTGPVCEPDACETSHPLKPLVVAPVPLGSLPWNAMLIMLVLALGMRKMVFKVK